MNEIICSKCSTQDKFEEVITKNDFDGSSGYLQCKNCKHRSINITSKDFGDVNYFVIKFFIGKEY